MKINNKSNVLQYNQLLPTQDFIIYYPLIIFFNENFILALIIQDILKPRFEINQYVQNSKDNTQNRSVIYHQ